ncbi:MAG: hypothetical protein A2140_04415 [Candidatus Muproteobacteria bacterium RBG_16_62_13]|uniref:Uncharacterized protein n=1 Tax=Candidatus Muproteobacteria bacterium RBG_16_62_13 TaxID=1817756 RepID=A0A1F6T7Z4_9PROT|nr:MAG: hypothetical protein A2140_04415 [Candidatus Muproteobacteria bacterium RBG_16_62_13]
MINRSIGCSVAATTIRAIGAFRTLGSFDSFNTLRPLRTFHALWLLGTFNTLLALRICCFARGAIMLFTKPFLILTKTTLSI